MSPNPELIFGSEGDLLLYSGPALPAVFVPYSIVRPLDRITYHIPPSEVITGQISLLILGSLLPGVRDIRAIEKLPKSIPPGTAAFRIKHARCTYAYINAPEAAGLDDWASRNHIHCLITPISCDFTSLARKQSWFCECALTRTWEQLHAKFGLQQVLFPETGAGVIPIDSIADEEDLP
jgi:hypothetical protein